MLSNHGITNFHGNITCRKFKNTSVFNIHDPKGIKYLFQLRMNLNPLRSHKKHHNFADIPLDICVCNQGIEDTRHFLFECLKFATHRASLAVTDVLHRNNLIDPANNIELYLYVQPTLISVDNKCILSATIQYMKNLQRFCFE